jgi:hypothetical protein
VAQSTLVGPGSTGGFQFKPSTSRPEKLFSSKLLLNQRALNNSNRNIDQAQPQQSQQQLVDEPNFLSNNAAISHSSTTMQQQTNNNATNKTRTNEFDSADTNSANSQLSLNSGSQSTDYLKGAIKNKKLNGLAADPNQMLNDLMSKTSGLKSTTVAGNMSQLGSIPTSNANKFSDLKSLNQSSSNLNEKVKIYLGDKSDGTVSDSALTNNAINSTSLSGVAATNANMNTTTVGTVANVQENANVLNNKKRRPSMAKALVILGLSKKSNSASNLALGKRFGFARSEEYGVVPELRSRSTNAGDSSNEDKPKQRYYFLFLHVCVCNTRLICFILF